MNENHLSDAAMRDFISHGYTLVQSDQPPAFHQEICWQLDEVIASEGNPGNNVMAVIPELHQVRATTSFRACQKSSRFLKALPFVAPSKACWGPTTPCTPTDTVTTTGLDPLASNGTKTIMSTIPTHATTASVG